MPFLRLSLPLGVTNHNDEASHFFSFTQEFRSDQTAIILSTGACCCSSKGMWQPTDLNQSSKSSFDDTDGSL